jgi:arylsulfatase A-like enzyme
MRHDHAGCYGYHKPTTPNVDRLASEGMVFSNCYATDTPTQPCYTATMTGKRGNTTGVVSHGQPEDTIPSVGWGNTGGMTLAQVLSENGVLTAAVSTLYRFRRWFAQGFTHYLQPDIGTWLQHVTAKQVNEQALGWLEAYGHRRDFFLFLHYWDPHTPYRMVNKEYIRRFYEGKDPYDPGNTSLEDLRARPLMDFFISGGAVPELKEGLTDVDYPTAQYDAEIFTADEGFGEVLSVLDRLKILDDTMIIFVSDHGEALGEHGVYFDHMDAYEQVSHVPLVVWRPGKVKQAKTEAFVQHIDFAPTILEAFGVDGNCDFEGRSLWPLLRGAEDEHYDTVFTNHGLWSVQRVMRTREWSLVKTFEPGMLERKEPGWELFYRKEDPAEAADVSGENSDVLGQLKFRYFEWLDENLGSRPDPLRALATAGNVAASVKRRYAAHLEAARRDPGSQLTPGDRARLDDKPNL